MTGSSYLILLLGLFLSCFSLPSDVKTKTIQTITTKPVRSTEIVLGRILGFVAVGTLLLLGMGVVSYEFVRRGIRHTHDVESVLADGTGNTTYDVRHAHTFQMLEDQSVGVTDTVKGHTHVVRRRGDGTYEVGEPEGLLNARIPIFGKLHMTDRGGNTITRGLNVGYESEYQTFIEGASAMSAVWTFNPVSKAQFMEGDVLPIELTLQAFRTYKGDIVTGVRGEIFLRNEGTGVETERSQRVCHRSQGVPRYYCWFSWWSATTGQHLGRYLRKWTMAGCRALHGSWAVFWYVDRRPLFACW